MSQQRNLYSAKCTMFCDLFYQFQISLPIVIITFVSETVRLPITELHSFFFRSAVLQWQSKNIFCFYNHENKIDFTNEEISSFGRPSMISVV